MYALNRFQYLPTLQKQLNENDVVLLDRYVFSNMAYSAAKYNAEAQSQIIMDWINEFEFGFLELPYPDLTVFFDVPVKELKKRLKNIREGDDRKYLNGKIDIHEDNIDYQIAVRKNYLALKDYQSYVIIDTQVMSPEEIFNKYKKHLDKVLFNKIMI